MPDSGFKERYRQVCARLEAMPRFSTVGAKGQPTFALEQIQDFFQGCRSILSQHSGNPCGRNQREGDGLQYAGSGLQPRPAILPDCIRHHT